MRCANCGNELKAGSLYCDVCGHPVQIVPDYNEFDDYLDNLVGNDDRRTDGQKTAKLAGPHLCSDCRCMILPEIEHHIFVFFFI